MGAEPNRLDEPGRPLLETFEASDGYVFYYRRWSAVGKRKATLLFLHGIQSHGGWYTRSCAKLAEEGYEVYFLDRRGCGLNTARRGDTPSFRRLLDDIGEFAITLKTSASLLFLGAISWGGKLACAMPYRHPGLIDAMVLMCPGLFAQVSPTLTTRLLIGRSAVRAPTKMFDIPLNNPALFTASPEWRTYIADDRFALRQATGRMLFQSLSLDIYLRRAWRHVHVPTLLLLAGKDRVVNNNKVRRYVERFPTEDRKIFEYPEAHHTLEFEPEPQEWFRDLSAWLKSHSR